MNRILIMVLSYNESPYKELMEAQQASWDSVEVEGVGTIYYHGGLMAGDNVNCSVLIKNEIWSREIQFKCTDSYYLMAHKWKLALEYAKDWDYQYIFRSNSSSYINKQRLKEFSETLPKEKVYAGWTMVDSEDHGGLAVSGAGIWLSRDTADILREQIDPKVEMEEDVYASRILRRNGIVAIDDKSRVDYPQDRDKDIHSAYHIRFKGPHGNRYKDAEDMRLVHQKIINNS